MTNCKNCRFFHETRPSRKTETTFGQCRVNPPTNPVNRDRPVTDGWPEVTGVLWCGRFEQGDRHDNPALDEVRDSAQGLRDHYRSRLALAEKSNKPDAKYSVAACGAAIKALDSLGLFLQHK